MLHNFVIAIGGLAAFDLVLSALVGRAQTKKEREDAKAAAGRIKPMTDGGPGIPPAPPPTSQ